MSAYHHLYILYGNHCISNEKINITKIDFHNSTPNILQLAPIPRGAGDTVVTNRLASKNITLEGGLLSARNQDSHDIAKLILDLHSIFDEQKKFLRIVPKSRTVLILKPTDNWQTFFGSFSNDFNSDFDLGGVSNLVCTLDKDDYQITGQSAKITFNLPSNQSVFTIFTQFAGVDLSDKNQKGNFEFWFFIENARFLESVKMRLGNSQNQAYYSNIISNYENKKFNNGWNYVSVPWGNTEQGLIINKTTTNPNDANISYFALEFKYAGDVALPNTMTVKFGGLLWVDENYTRNYPCIRSQSIQHEGEYYLLSDYTKNNFTVELVNYTGCGYATHDITIFDQTVNTSKKEHEFNFKGNFPPQLNHQIKINSDYINTLIINNLSTNTRLQMSGSIDDVQLPNNAFIDDVFEIGDEIYISGSQLRSLPYITTNGEPTTFAGKIPTNQPGKNIYLIQAIQGLVSIKQTTRQVYVAEGLSLNRWLAQKFTPNFIFSKLKEIRICLLVRKDPAIAKIEIRADDNNKPHPSNIFYSTNVFVDNTSLKGVITLYPDISLANNTSYWLVLQGDNNDTTNLTTVVRADNNGQLKVTNNITTWSDYYHSGVNTDIYYELYFSLGDEPVEYRHIITYRPTYT